MSSLSVGSACTARAVSGAPGRGRGARNTPRPLAAHPSAACPPALAALLPLRVLLRGLKCCRAVGEMDHWEGVGVGAAPMVEAALPAGALLAPGSVGSPAARSSRWDLSTAARALSIRGFFMEKEEAGG